MASVKKPVISSKPVAAKITISKSATASTTTKLAQAATAIKTATVSKPAVLSKTTPRLTKPVDVKPPPGKTASKPAAAKASPAAGAKAVAKPTVIKGVADSTTKSTTSSPLKKPLAALTSPIRAAKPAAVATSAKGPLNSKTKSTTAVRSSVAVNAIGSKAVDLKIKGSASTRVGVTLKPTSTITKSTPVPTTRPKPASAKPETNKSSKSVPAPSSVKTASGTARKTPVKSKPVVGASASSSSRTTATAAPKSIRTRPVNEPRTAEACSDVEIRDADSTSSPHIDDFENPGLSLPVDLERVPIDENRLYEVAEEILLTVINVHDQESRETVDRTTDFKSDDIGEEPVTDFTIEKQHDRSEDQVTPETAALGDDCDDTQSDENRRVDLEMTGKEEHEPANEEVEIVQSPPDENEVRAEDSHSGEQQNVTAQTEEFETLAEDSEEVATDEIELVRENAGTDEERAACQDDPYGDSGEPQLVSEDDHSEDVTKDSEASCDDSDEVPVESEHDVDENGNVPQTQVVPEDDSGENDDENAEVLPGTDECADESADVRNDETVSSECDIPHEESGGAEEVDENGVLEVAENTRATDEESCIERAEVEPSADSEQIRIVRENDNVEGTSNDVDDEIEIQDDYFCENAAGNDRQDQKDDRENSDDQCNGEDFVLVNVETAEDQRSLNDEAVPDSESVTSADSISYAEIVKQPSRMCSCSEDAEDRSSNGGADEVPSYDLISMGTADSNCYEEISLEEAGSEKVAAAVSETNSEYPDPVPECSNGEPECATTEQIVRDRCDETRSEEPRRSSAERLAEARLMFFEERVDDREYETTMRKKRSNKKSNKRYRKSNRMSVVEQPPQGERRPDDFDERFYDVEHRPKRRNSKRFRNWSRKQSKELSDTESNVYTTQLWKNCYQKY